MARFIRCLGKWGVGLILAIAVLMLRPAPASAYIEIDYSIDGGARTYGNSSSGALVGFAQTNLGGLFDLSTSFAWSNTPGSPFQAYIDQSDTWITTDYTTGQHTLTIYVSATGFTSPSSPPPVNLGITSTTDEQGGGVAVTFQGFADPTNTLFGMSGTSTPGTGNTYTASGQAGIGSGGPLTTTFNLDPGPNGYSLTDVISMKIDGGTDITNTASNLTVVTPAPAGIVLAASGLPLLALGCLRRRLRRA